MSKKQPTMRNKVDYLSQRPFLIIDIYYVPARGAKTHMKNWTSVKGAWDTQENPYVVDRVTLKHSRRASVIIDILKRKMLKCRFDDAHSNEVFNHFTNKYSEQINHAINMWRNKNGLAAEMALTENPIPEGGITITMDSAF